MNTSGERLREPGRVRDAAVDRFGDTAVSPVHRGIGREEVHSNDGELTNGCKKAWRRAEGRREEGWPQVELAQVKRTQELAPEVVV